MSTAILTAEVQTRIDALTYSSGTTQALEVLQLAVDTVGLTLDLTNIISVHTSMTAAVVTGTSENDLTALNAASLALGITSNTEESNALPQLAPDLTYPGDRNNLNFQTVETISGINGSAGLVTALLLTEKSAFSYLAFTGTSAESMTVKLTIDGVVIWNSTFLATSSSQMLLGYARQGQGAPEMYSCKETLLLEVQTASDTSISLDYLARPIL
jgi:hypothetical protein